MNREANIKRQISSKFNEQWMRVAGECGRIPTTCWATGIDQRAYLRYLKTLKGDLSKYDYVQLRRWVTKCYPPKAGTAKIVIDKMDCGLCYDCTKVSKFVYQMANRKFLRSLLRSGIIYHYTKNHKLIFDAIKLRFIIFAIFYFKILIY